MIAVLALVAGLVAGLRSEIGEARAAMRQLAIELEARSQETESRIADLRRRRRSAPRGDGPIDETHEIAHLNRILVDEMLVLIEHTAATQTILARTLAGSREP